MSYQTRLATFCIPKTEDFVRKATNKSPKNKFSKLISVDSTAIAS